jgi:hypothetical protein
MVVNNENGTLHFQGQFGDDVYGGMNQPQHFQVGGNFIGRVFSYMMMMMNKKKISPKTKFRK